jgi:methionine synthase I (cobalamin-dependent)
MEDLSPEVLATVVAEKFGDSYGAVINAVMREDLARRVERALREALVAARNAAAALCLERQALWVATEAGPTSPEHLRAEARSRANEAAYLADAIQSLP